MKELTIEEKAKAYDNIIKKANKMHSENCEACQMCIEELIPELKESGDERIRKALIEGFKVMNAGSYGECTFSNYNIPVIDIITWLEKQGNLVKYYEDKLDRCACDNFNKGYKKALEKQGEQNTSEWRQDNVEELTEFENVMMHIGSSFFGENAGLNPNDTTCIKEQANLLLELVEQKPEWSEEDSPYYDDICEILINLLHSKTANVNKDAIQKDLDWLISIKPQNNWKPSKFQLGGLSDAIIKYEAQGINAIALKELLEQLKKLKE